MKVRPSLNAVAAPIFGEFLLGMTVAMAGLYLASHTSDAAAGTFGLTQQVLETLFVIFRVLAIGLGVVVTQLIGSGQQDAVKRTSYMALAASTWAGLRLLAWWPASPEPRRHGRRHGLPPVSRPRAGAQRPPAARPGCRLRCRC